MKAKYLGKTKGIITVYLSLIILLILSFIVSVLEISRVTACKAELAILSNMSGSSLRGNYYYPLFEEYGLMALDGGYGKARLNEGKIKSELLKPIEYSLKNSADYLLRGGSAAGKVRSIQTFMDDNNAAFLTQIRKETIHEGAELAIAAMLGKNLSDEIEVLPEIYEKQAEAMTKASEVTTELLKLMSLIDGVKTTETGLATDDKGELCPVTPFIKMLGVKDESYMKGTFGSEEVYNLGSSNIWYLSSQLGKLKEEFASLVETEVLIGSLKSEISILEESLEQGADAGEKPEENTEAIAATAEKRASAAEKNEELNEALLNAIEAHTEQSACCKAGYTILRAYVNEIKELYEKALLQMGLVLAKQKIAEATAEEYKTWLEGFGNLEGGIIESFIEDAANLKSYMHLEKYGYDTKKMLEELTTNYSLICLLILPPYDAEEGATQAFIDVLETNTYLADGLTFDSLKFNYTGLKTAGTEITNAEDTIRGLLSDGVLNALGIENISKKEINGLDLPSKGQTDKQSSNIFEVFEKMQLLLKNTNVSELILGAMQELSADFLMEVYLYNHFSDYRDKTDTTRLQYEREYILYGNESDNENLANFAMSLLAFRTVFTFAALMADSGRQAQAESVAIGVAGFTGIPALLYVVKYAIITAWAIEEAMVEVCAIFEGKRPAFFSIEGRVNMYEILTINGTQIKAKAASVTNSPDGLAYSQYILIFSLLQGKDKKLLRTMDLIQENIRLRYRDSFRMANCVSGVEYTVTVELKPWLSAPVITKDFYNIGKNTDTFF